MFEDVQWLFQQAQASEFEGVTHSFAQPIDKGHGRPEIRRCWTLSQLDYLIQAARWKGLQTIVMVQSERRCNGQTTLENRSIGKFRLSQQVYSEALRQIGEL